MDSYALIDFGDGRKLERFGQVVLDRVSPAAIGTERTINDWSEADLRLDERGEAIGEENTLVLASRFVIGKTPGALVANLSTTSAMDDLAAKRGKTRERA